VVLPGRLIDASKYGPLLCEDDSDPHALTKFKARAAQTQQKGDHGEIDDGGESAQAKQTDDDY